MRIKQQDGYGISLTRLSWAAALIERQQGARLVTLAERVWDDHHDVLARAENESFRSAT